MKVVIHVTYGGFHIPEAVQTALRERGVACDGETGFERTDEALVSAVEAVEAASPRGTHRRECPLHVVEVPDGVDWVVENHDGCEWVSERHRTWQ